MRVAIDADIVIDSATLFTQFNSARGPPPPIDGSETDAEDHFDEDEESEEEKDKDEEENDRDDDKKMIN